MPSDYANVDLLETCQKGDVEKVASLLDRSASFERLRQVYGYYVHVFDWALQAFGAGCL